MFEYSLLHWTTFFTAVVLLELSPGADMAFMMRQTVRNGKTAGFAALFGSLSANFFHIAMAVIGLSAIIATSAVAFTVVKWAGVVYLVWLGYQAISSSMGNSSTIVRTNSADTSSDRNRLGSVHSNHSIYLQASLITILNPKVAIFFLAFLPQFVVEGAGSVGYQMLLHGVLMTIVGFFLQAPIILMGSRIASSLKESQSIRKWFDRCIGAVFIAMGFKLAVSKLD
ncbi:MAG: LysE family translocator [Pseudomonadota bacterium]